MVRNNDLARAHLTPVPGPEFSTERFIIPKKTKYDMISDFIRNVLHDITSTFLHEDVDVDVDVDRIRGELEGLLYELGFADIDEFLAEHELAAVLTALKFSARQIAVFSPGGFLRTIVEGGERGDWSKFTRQRVGGYIKHEKSLCKQEVDLLTKWMNNHAAEEAAEEEYQRNLSQRLGYPSPEISNGDA